MKISTIPILVTTLFLSAFLSADDWPQWRGAKRDGVSTETGLLQQWPAGGPKLAWKTSGLGGGYSGVAITGGKVYTLGDLADGSYAIAISESDGSPIWKTRIGEAGGHRKYPGTRCTPTVDGGQVFVLNQYSDVACLDAASGKLIWRKNLENNFGGKMMSGWKYSESPLVDGNQVIVTPGGKNGTLLALDRNNGNKIWQTRNWQDTAGYSSVVVATIHGTRQYIQLTGDSVAGVDPGGNILWKAKRKGRIAVIPTPIVRGNIVFVTSGYGVGCNGFLISKNGNRWSASQLYANKSIANHHGGAVLVDGHVYGSSGSTFRSVNLENGRQNFAARSVGKGSTVFADGRFYLRSEEGPVALLAASPGGLKEYGRFSQPERSDEKAWPHPVVANGKLYLRDQDLLLVYDVAAN